MTGISPEAASELQLLADQMADVQRRAEAAAALRDEVDAMRESGTSAGREVTVEVDSIGRLVDITFSAGASRLSPDDLASVVLDTVGAARERIGHAVMARIEDTFGAGSATAEAMRPTYLPPPEPDSDGDDGPGPGRGPMMYTRR
jgi:YbaB/EbfC DNA-binding family protein